MSEITKAVYVTLKKGFHKSGLDIESEFSKDFDAALYEKAENIVKECNEKGIKIHLTHRNDLPPVLYIKGKVKISGTVIAVAGPSNIDEKTALLLEGFIKGLNFTENTVICGDKGESEELALKRANNPMIIMYDGNFDAYDNAISEFYPGTPSKKEYFKYKNELMCKLCDLLVFSEIKDNSRSRKILDYAKSINKETVILYNNESFKLPPLKINLPNNAVKVYNTFTDYIMEYDSILNNCELSEEELTMALFTLTLKGIIKKAPMGRYELVANCNE